VKDGLHQRARAWVRGTGGDGWASLLIGAQYAPRI
jgi:hypothetical protein